MWEVNIQVTKKAWMDHPEDRWNAGLERAGMNFRTGLSRSHYPPVAAGGYTRTYQTADQANFNITEPGRVMEFGSTFYLPFILYGTRKWEGWPGKMDELTDLMQRGFASGVKEFEG